MFAACIGFAACSGVDSAKAVSSTVYDTLPGGVIRVENRAPSDSGKWALVLERTVQPDEDTPGALRVPDDILLLDDGELLVADAKPAEIMRYDSTGKYTGSIGREGAGPGEYRAPWMAAHGDTLVVQDPTLSRAVTFALSTGASLTQRATVPRYYSKIGVDGEGRAVAPMMLAADSAAGPRQGFVRFALNGSSMDTAILAEHPRGDARWVVREGKNIKFEMTVPLQPRDVHAVDPTGGFVTGWSGEFVLRATSNGRDTVRLITRRPVEASVSASEKTQIVEATIEQMKGQAPPEVLRASLVTSAIPDQRPAFDYLHVDTRGRIWARRATTDSTRVWFDFFDHDGRWLDVLSVPANGWNTSWWRPVSFARDHVAVLVEDSDGRPSVLVYRVEHRQ